MRLHTDAPDDCKAKWGEMRNRFKKGCDRNILQKCSEILKRHPSGRLSDCNVLTCSHSGFAEQASAFKRQLINITRTQDNSALDYGEILFVSVSSEDRQEFWKVHDLKIIGDAMKSVIETEIATHDGSMVEYLISIDTDRFSDNDSDSDDYSGDDMWMEQFLF